MTKKQLIKVLSDFPDDANIISVFNTNDTPIKEFIDNNLIFEPVPETSVASLEANGKTTGIAIISRRINKINLEK